jgi:hypothetical protein
MSLSKDAQQIQAPKRGCVRGSGALHPVEQEIALDMLRAGTSQRVVAEAFGVTKNTIAGIWARHGEPQIIGTYPEPTTLPQRLDALNAKLDRVLAETRGVGILAPEPKAGRQGAGRR